MTEHSINLHWQRAEAELKTRAYLNPHTEFNDRHDLQVDAAPDWASDPANAKPKQALAAKAGWPVASCQDHAAAHLGKNPNGQMSVTRIDLRPVVRCDTGFAVDDATLAKMQDSAHRSCFVANALVDSVEVNIL